ncbi:hypothetical protein SAMN05660860_00906 [Geoalkalibacter ferrihydriticus]|uniref:Uncharacterized protein n=2 Tax=Geoalkalibacter ferrihydriticus TaxID=392333 RepID=A0A0C2DVM6_9BACT|nr:hypothetical protein [Geoalkalibacter ferrihydriticus]KIH77499.1 hypothetical protein GFER_01970 [Geoalkalibacter ferrihydriticus DSM 17813]SDL64624.1 hypothetical protein SAMN05660860_00906 [Geoalkalibacter ferrihydriticus]
MKSREELARRVAEIVCRQFAMPLIEAPTGDLNSVLAREISQILSHTPDPYGQIIRDWDGLAHQLDLAWWESEPTPNQIVLGLAAAILEYEVRLILDLPR